MSEEDFYKVLLSLATATDKERARSYLNPRSVQLGLAFAAASFPEDLDFKAIARDFQISETRARQLFRKWKKEHPNSSP